MYLLKFVVFREKCSKVKSGFRRDLKNSFQALHEIILTQRESVSVPSQINNIYFFFRSSSNTLKTPYLTYSVHHKKTTNSQYKTEVAETFQNESKYVDFSFSFGRWGRGAHSGTIIQLEKGGGRINLYLVFPYSSVRQLRCLIGTQLLYS